MSSKIATKTLLKGLACLFGTLPLAASCAEGTGVEPNSYEALTELFADWREFEAPPLLDGAPDYTAERFAAAYEAFAQYRARLDAIDPSGWPIAQQVDWHIVNAEMNGFDFNHRVLKPWVRDPAFYQSIWTYQSDVPAHEGPTHHAVLELWTYEFPLSADEEQRMIGDLRVIPRLCAKPEAISPATPGICGWPASATSAISASTWTASSKWRAMGPARR